MNKMIKQCAVPVLCGFFVFMLFKLVFFIGYVPSESMEPTIKSGSCIMGCRIVCEIQRGDIVVFKHNGYMLVKRVAAIPGDAVYIDETGLIISVNKEIQESASIFIVPNECYFMQGDNIENSIDSRSWKEPFIQKKDVIAKVWK